MVDAVGTSYLGEAGASTNVLRRDVKKLVIMGLR